MQWYSRTKFYVYLRGKYCTACILNLCRTSIDVLVCCIIYMLMRHKFILHFEARLFFRQSIWCRDCMSEIKLRMERNMPKLNYDWIHCVQVQVKNLASCVWPVIVYAISCKHWCQSLLFVPEQSIDNMLFLR